MQNRDKIKKLQITDLQFLIVYVYREYLHRVLNLR